MTLKAGAGARHWTVRAMRNGNAAAGGFTLLELLVVLVLVALLASLATPLVTGSIERAEESALKENLFVLRKAIDGYYADHAAYPSALEDLVDERYIRAVPEDPVTGSKGTWVLVRNRTDRGRGGIRDVHSGAEGKGSEGVPYSEW